jgi:hypothetical protein
MLKSIFIGLLLFFSACNSMYNNQIGNYSAITSAITYCPEKEVELWTCHWCKKLPRMNMLNTFWDRHTSTYCYFAYDVENKHHVLAFEGSQDLRDWLIDFDFIKLVPYKDHPTAKVHAGFWHAYTSVRENIHNTIYYNNVSRLFITGHSLGGALATLSSLDISESLSGFELFMVNLGGPRVGNKEYAELYNSQNIEHFRITHGTDPVPHLPPMIFGYYHIDTEVFYPNSTMNYMICSEAENPQCADGQNIKLWETSDHLTYLDIQISFCGGI